MKISRNHLNSYPEGNSGQFQKAATPIIYDLDVFKSLGCTWMIDHNGNYANLDGGENGELSVECFVVRS